MKYSTESLNQSFYLSMQKLVTKISLESSWSLRSYLTECDPINSQILSKGSSTSPDNSRQLRA